MASRTSAGDNGSGDGADPVSNRFPLEAQDLGLLQQALHLQNQEAERKVQEALRLQQMAERRLQEELPLHEQRAEAAMREMERKLQEKDDAILALQLRLQEIQERVTSMEERTLISKGSRGQGGLRQLERRVEKVKTSLQNAMQKVLPRVEALLHQLEESKRASLVTTDSTSAASVREAPATGGAGGGGEEPPSSTPTPTPTSPSDAPQGAAVDEEEEEERSWQLMEFRVREVKFRMERAQTFPCPLGEQLCEAAFKGILSDVQRLIDYGADVNYTSEDGFCPLINAAWKASLDVVSLLLQRGADANAVNCGADSALHFAAMQDPSGRCLAPLVDAGADVNARNKNGVTPLCFAAKRNYENTVRALLAAGARKELSPWSGVWRYESPFALATSSVVKDLLRLQLQEQE